MDLRWKQTKYKTSTWASHCMYQHKILIWLTTRWLLDHPLCTSEDEECGDCQLMDVILPTQHGTMVCDATCPEL